MFRIGPKRHWIYSTSPLPNALSTYSRRVMQCLTVPIKAIQINTRARCPLLRRKMGYTDENMPIIRLTRITVVGRSFLLDLIVDVVCHSIILKVLNGMIEVGVGSVGFPCLPVSAGNVVMLRGNSTWNRAQNYSNTKVNSQPEESIKEDNYYQLVQI